MDENESYKREDSILGPGRVMPKTSRRGLSSFRAAISRFQPEGHENISRPRADHEIRVSDFEITASGGSGALFSTSGEQELLSGEKLPKPLPTAQACISEGSHSEGCHSSHRHFLATPLSDSERADREVSGNVSLHVDLDGKVDEQDQKLTLPSPQRSWQAPVDRCMRRHNDVVSGETSGGTQANLQDTSSIRQVNFGSSIAQENVRESECAKLAEKDGFSVHAKTSAVGDLNSVVSSTFDVGSLEQHSNSLSDAVGSFQQLEKEPMSTMPELANSYLHFSRSWQGPVNCPVRQHNEVVSEETGEGMQANSRDTIPINQISLGSSTARENVRESEHADLAEKHDFSVHAEISAVGDLNSVAWSNFDVGFTRTTPRLTFRSGWQRATARKEADVSDASSCQLLWPVFTKLACFGQRCMRAQKQRTHCF